jgi:hypothetical protein
MERIALFFFGVFTLIASFLFMCSPEGIRRINQLLSRSFCEKRFSRGHLFDRKFFLDEIIIKYRLGFSLCLAAAAIFMIISSLYFME